MHPGGRGEAKRWPPDRFAAVIDALEGPLGCDVILAGGPDESELVRQVDHGRANAQSVALERTPPIPVLYALLAECSLFVGNDSGPAHMAEAVGTPTCVLFGATRPTMWRTLGPLDEVVEPPVVPCDDCLRPDVCGPGRLRYCGWHVTTEQVVETIERMLGKIAPAGSIRA